jgi:hypothetical protein
LNFPSVVSLDDVGKIHGERESYEVVAYFITHHVGGLSAPKNLTISAGRSKHAHHGKSQDWLRRQRPFNDEQDDDGELRFRSIPSDQYAEMERKQCTLA